MKLQKTKSGQYFLTLPKDIIIGFGWEKKDLLEFAIVGKSQLLIKKKIS